MWTNSNRLREAGKPEEVARCAAARKLPPVFHNHLPEAVAPEPYRGNWGLVLRAANKYPPDGFDFFGLVALNLGMYFCRWE